MKKFLGLLLAITMCCSLVALSACGGGKNYKAVKMEGIEVEEYGFAISKNATNKAEVLAAMNKVISDLGTTKIANQLTYQAMLESGETGTAAFEVPDPTTATTNGTLVMYTNASFPPYEYMTNKGIEGLDVDMMKLVANELGMAFKSIDMDFDSLTIEINKLEANKTKVVAAGMTINDERKETVDFSNPYITSVQYMVCNKEATFTKAEDLKGKKIGVQLGTTGDFYIDGQIKKGILKDSGAELVQYKSAALAFAAMKAGKIDVVVIDEHPAKSLEKNQ